MGKPVLIVIRTESGNSAYFLNSSSIIAPPHAMNRLALVPTHSIPASNSDLGLMHSSVTDGLT